MPASPCSPGQIAKIQKTYAKTKSTRETARILRCSENTVNKYRDGATDPVKAAEERAELARELSRERELLRDVAGEKSFRSFLSDLIAKNVPPLPVQKPSKPLKVAGNCTLRYPLLSLNDWHFEEVVKSESVLGLNEYSIPIACRRVSRVIRACVDWKRDIEAGGRFRIPELTVALNGDFLTGTLHGLEKHSSAPNVVRATLACGQLIALALRDLAAEFQVVRVIGTVGNHGRLPDQKKVPTKDPTRSFDYLAYGVARAILGNYSGIEWTLPEAYGVLYDVAGHQVYQAHGNFIPQSLGIVGYGVRRFTSALAANLSAAGKPLRYALFGHWHQSNSSEFAGVTTFISPSLIGTQEYGFLSGGQVNRAAQLLLVFDKDLGHTGTEVLYGDGPGDCGSYALAV